jgi:F-type H+-transporting ATPase subunit a
MELKGGLEWGLPLPGLDHHAAVVGTNILIVILLVLGVFFLICRRAKLKPSIPQMMIETIVGTAEGFLRDIGGARTVKYAPFCVAIFLYVLAANLIGLIPGFVSPTGEVMVNAALAICVFFMAFFVGIREIGLLNYIKHKMGPVLALGWLVFIFESIGELARPLSLTLRLFGNIRGEDILSLTVANLIVNVGELIPATASIAPVLQWAVAQTVSQALMLLMVLTSFIQAFIFSFLPILYFGAAVGWGESEHH